ncbi:hypothetical protein ABNQ39_00305 (plasmid) [Azospirillum sp. A26]|uniref:hypothetical protein n=1 Tax=Azospirillum sp. A26 TaxID=3160607 RepID=UPI0036725BF7
MATMFKAVYGSPRPVTVECEVPAYPNADADGCTIYENTHFLSEAEAWERVLAEHDAGLSLEARRVKNLRAELEAAEKSTATAAILATEAREAFRQWERRQTEDDAGQAGGEVGNG